MTVAREKPVPSDEADQRQLDLARSEGDAYQKSLEYMVQKVAHVGAKQVSGDYIVGFAQEEAEGLYRPEEDGTLVWQEPRDENCHLEVSVSDAFDHRFIPGLSVAITLVSENGETVGPLPAPFLWHPGLYHYGTNVRLPGNGRYDVTVRIEPPAFPRHDKMNGNRYSNVVEVKFSGVEIEIGEK